MATIFILSDGTGETASTMIRAALVQYSDLNINIVRCKNVRTEEQIEALMGDVSARQGLIVFTMVGTHMSRKVMECAAQRGLVAVDLMGPLLTALDKYFGRNSESHTAGLLRAVDERYFKRIEAIEYTVKHDDGKTMSDLDQADIVLVGISRTSKTPLSIFLSHKGWKVANVPVVLNTALPEELFKVDQRRVVGLTIDPAALTRIRKKRLEKFGQDPGGEYANMAHIQQELEYARTIFKQNRRWPVFDVTDRALEETAAEIIRVVASRLDIPYTSIL
ncbi:MAG: pyruvate, water dikinase regulatory protein [Bdellovibrionales bacterium]